MSFTQNPYKHLSVIVEDDGSVRPECDSCEYEWQREAPFPPDTPVRVIVGAFQAHVLLSHKRTPKDFIGWS